LIHISVVDNSEKGTGETVVLGSELLWRK